MKTRNQDEEALTAEAIIEAVPSSVAIPIPSKWTALNTLVYFVTKSLSRLVFNFLYQIRVEMEKDLKDLRSSSVVILPKHQHWTDIPLLMLSFPFPVQFVAKHELFQNGTMRAYLSAGGTIPLDRTHPTRTLNGLKYLFARLRTKGKIVVFPEGTYFKNYVGPGKARLIQMVLTLQSGSRNPVLFLPVGIRYKGKVFWRKKVTIRTGLPLLAQERSEAPDLICRVMQEICRLSQLPQG